MRYLMLALALTLPLSVGAYDPEDLKKLEDTSRKLAAECRQCDLMGAFLAGNNLMEANLRGANLWEAELWGANLEDADLTSANLEGANLSGAKPVQSHLLLRFRSPNQVGWAAAYPTHRRHGVGHGLTAFAQPTQLCSGA